MPVLSRPRARGRCWTFCVRCTMDGSAIQRWAGVLGATGVGMGAFGAHALKATLEANGRTSTFQTGGEWLPHCCLMGWLAVATLDCSLLAAAVPSSQPSYITLSLRLICY